MNSSQNYYWSIFNKLNNIKPQVLVLKIESIQLKK